MKKILLFLIIFPGFFSCDIVDYFLPNSIPVANAGPDQSVSLGQKVVLDGSKSYDSDGDKISYLWHWLVSPDGSQALFYDYNKVSCYITPDLPGTYIILLVVNDKKEDSAPDKVIIHVN
ncbi:MAG: hypothetical protein JXR70_11490 [Spirochaetales bacterium]|nr:hypothetical protein [Spirochaetales bacterium]